MLGRIIFFVCVYVWFILVVDSEDVNGIEFSLDGVFGEILWRRWVLVCRDRVWT